jgi:hypothetical protein
MKIKLSVAYVLTFLSLTFVMHEAHEIVHTSVGRLLCGCWGQRDFNVWTLCEGCAERNSWYTLATFAGPAFTFCMMGIGAILVGKNKSNNLRAIGFSLIFANMPLARILTASLGGGDEVWALNQLLKNYPMAWCLGLGIILVISFLPLQKAYTSIENKRRIGWFLGFLIVPILADVLIVLGILNTLLDKEVLSSYWILGSPIIVSVWTILVSSIFLFTWKNLFRLVDKSNLT